MIPATFPEWMSLALWCAGAAHFCILGASFQVPSRLGWKEDLAKLTAFNRKIMWTYGGFIVLTITGFGALTCILHDELLRGERAALYLAGFIAVFWTARIAVDFFYYGHEDWPKGRLFAIGHCVLTTVFALLAAVYWGLVAWHAAGGSG